MPAWPAYLLLFASIPLLVPTLPRRLGARVAPVTSRPVASPWIAVAAIATVLVPGVAIAASSALDETQQKTVVQDFESGNILTPVDDGLRLDAKQEGAARRLTWTEGGPWRSDVFYRVYRHDGPGDDTICLRSGNVAWYCFLRSEVIATTRDRSFVDPDGTPTATYRVGVGTNWADDPEAGDIFAFSPPVAVRG